MQNRNIKQESVYAAECVIDSCHSNCSCFPVSGYSARSKNKKKDVLVHLEAGSSVPHRYMSALLSTAAGSVLQALCCRTCPAGQLVCVLKGGQGRKCLFSVCFKLPIKLCVVMLALTAQK